MAAPRTILAPEELEFYCHTLSVFKKAGIDTLVGGAYAFARYTGIERHTKDLDIFVRPADFNATIRALTEAGYATSVPFPHWLGKAYCGEYFVDVIFSSGNGVARVDDEWFEYAPLDTVFDIPVQLCPIEEMIWSKAFVHERERFDGADVLHLLLCCASAIDWQRLLRRFGPHWQVLLSHLVLFGFAYPSERDRLPSWVMQELMHRLQTWLAAPHTRERLCRGTLLSRQQYLTDIERGGYLDARLQPDNPMSVSDIATWTAAIGQDGRAQQETHAERTRHQHRTRKAEHPTNTSTGPAPTPKARISQPKIGDDDCVTE